MDKIIYYRKNVYGDVKLYLKDPKLARMVTNLTGKKTVTLPDLMILSMISGRAISEQLPPGGVVAEDRPEYGKVYALTGGTGEKCIANGNSWKESEVKGGGVNA